MKLPNAPRALITGAASGLGRALAVELARRKARILLADLDAEGAKETANLVLAQGGTAEFIHTDVGCFADVERAAQMAERLWGGVDLLVNNAGVAAVGPMGDVPLADWEWLLRVNLWGVIHGCHAWVPRMKARRSGFILNVASNAGIASLPEMGPYNASKAAVISISETLNAELAPYGIQVSALCPTFFPTNLLQHLRAPTARQRNLAQYFFDRSRTNAEEVARAGLAGLEKGQLIVIPQLDGALVWWAKRLAPSLYFALLRFQQRRDLLGRLAPLRAARSSPPAGTPPLE
jgi:NAD(P)-dependent dehydrogenase (short-subunit alcohol dehydrogenase family)